MGAARPALCGGGAGGGHELHLCLVHERARRLLHCDLAIYVGDDDTDEDAFVHTRAGRLLGIRVGPRRRSSAGYYLKDQHEIDLFLQRLVKLRRKRNRGVS